MSCAGSRCLASFQASRWRIVDLDRTLSGWPGPVHLLQTYLKVLQKSYGNFEYYLPSKFCSNCLYYQWSCDGISKAVALPIGHFLSFSSWINDWRNLLVIFANDDDFQGSHLNPRYRWRSNERHLFLVIILFLYWPNWLVHKSFCTVKSNDAMTA